MRLLLFLVLVMGLCGCGDNSEKKAIFTAGFAYGFGLGKSNPNLSDYAEFELEANKAWEDALRELGKK